MSPFRRISAFLLALTMAAVLPACSVETTPATPSPADLGTFKVSTDKPQLDVPADWRPYDRVSAVPHPVDFRDSTGVAMLKRGSTLINHPVIQTQDGLRSLESYRTSKDTQYLTRAKLDAQRLLDDKVERGSAFFFPYPFDFKVHGSSTNLMRAPWYSGMAQGQALSLFSRLAEITKDTSWRLAADATFVSLLLPRDAKNQSLPYVSWVDANKHLWIEEYAQQPPTKADHTFNGHVFAVFGVWDYYRLSQDPRAAQIFAGALETLRYHVNRGWRGPSWVSHYCLAHGTLSTKYHQIHIEQLRTLHAITANSDWSVWSDLFQNDYPNPELTSTVRLSAGTRVGYRFNDEGAVLASRHITLKAATNAPSSQRARVKNRSYYYLITAGPLSGYWVPEKAGVVSVQSLILATDYPYTRLATLAPGPHTGWTLTASKQKADSTTINLTSSMSASFDRSGWIDGAPYVHITNGSLAGRWVPTSGLNLH